jgi:signal transduction histidine kinase
MRQASPTPFPLTIPARRSQQPRLRKAGGAPARDAPASESVAQLAHDVQAPLAIVLALCERLLEAERLGATDADDVRGIRTAAQSVLGRIEQLLAAARLGSGAVRLDTARLDVAELVRRTAAPFESLAEARGQRLVVLGPARLEAVVDADSVATVLSNLIVNALKYTPPGGVIRCGVAARSGRVRLEVADSGPGIAPDLRQTVFDPYRRGSDAAAPGTGLGLAIVRELVHLHGGTVTIGDAPEGGALFAVELPCAGPADALAAPAARRRES